MKSEAQNQILDSALSRPGTQNSWTVACRQVSGLWSLVFISLPVYIDLFQCPSTSFYLLSERLPPPPPPELASGMREPLLQ